MSLLRHRSIWLAAVIALVGPCLSPAQSESRDESALAKGFRHPPAAAKPWIYWYWASGNVSREGITNDLQSMARVGIGEALIGIVDMPDVRPGPVKTLSDEWWTLIEHAIREGDRLGVDIGMFNAPGWSLSGGPWVKPKQAMQYLVARNDWAFGPGRQYDQRLPDLPQGAEHVAVVAFPAPRGYERGVRDDTIASRKPRVTTTPHVDQEASLCDGELMPQVFFPAEPNQSGSVAIDIRTDEPFTARSLVLHLAAPFASTCTLHSVDDQNHSTEIRTFKIDRTPSGGPMTVGPMQTGPVAVSFPAVTSNRFLVVMKDVRGQVALGEVELATGAVVERFVEKQLGVMHMTPQPPWDAYSWQRPDEPDETGLVVDPARIVDLTSRLEADGRLRWDVPPGPWIVCWVIMTPTGATNIPHSAEDRGLEVDKMSREAVKAHFDAYLGKLLARMPVAERRALKHVVVDSWEAGPQNWTDGFEQLFERRYGYSPLPWLPVLGGLVVGSAERSERFLWDLRRLVADRVASEYVGGLRDASLRGGLVLWLQNYGHWGFPAEFLQYGGQTDRISGEFWADGNLGSIEVRAAASCAHTYGMPIVSAESFTGGPTFRSTPGSLKRRADWAMTEGVNHFVLHVFFQQSTEALPGINASFGTEINRHNTWFDASRPWIDYLRSCQFLLQQGRHVADVAYFVGEDAPKMTGIREPALPPGFDFDYINAEVIEKRLTVKDGRFVLPDGTSYGLLVLPPLDTMRPELLQKISELVSAGGAVLGPPPVRSPSLQDHPSCDARVKDLAAKIWAGCDGKAVTHVRFGQGHVFRGCDLGAALGQLGSPPDVGGFDPEILAWTHRSAADAEIYFLSNQTDRAVSISPTFRVSGKAPELWDPDLREIARMAAFEVLDGRVRVPVELDPGGSVFVVFREDAGAGPAVSEVTLGGRVVLSAGSRPSDAQSDSTLMTAANDFTIALWANPAGDITLPAETDRGVSTDLVRNDALFPLHGAILFGGDTHASAGVSVGRNGITVYEHSTEYFAPILVQAAPIPAWIHVCVVYRGGRPSLYLNGVLAHEGLQSRHTVHASLRPRADDPAMRRLLEMARLETGKPFIGELGQIQRFARALTAAEVASLVRLPAETGAGRPLVSLTRGAGGELEAEVAAPGSYTVKLAGGGTRSFEVAPLPAPVAIDGPWEVQFPPNMDVPEHTRFKQLVSWPDHPNEAIRYFSGTATYGHDFVLPADSKGRRVLLDLGRVESLAVVVLNHNYSFDTLWKPPFVVDVTSFVRAGTNTLEVRVTNTWLNRLIGDKKFPNGFPGAGPLQFKPSLTRDISGQLGDALAPSGLIGPVRIRATQRIRVP